MARRVNFVSLKDGIDLSTAAGRLIANVLASVAEYENEVRSERVRAGQDAARAADSAGGDCITGRAAGSPDGDCHTGRSADNAGERSYVTSAGGNSHPQGTYENCPQREFQPGWQTHRLGK